MAQSGPERSGDGLYVVLVIFISSGRRTDAPVRRLQFFTFFSLLVQPFRRTEIRGRRGREWIEGMTFDKNTTRKPNPSCRRTLPFSFGFFFSDDALNNLESFLLLRSSMINVEVSVASVVKVRANVQRKTFGVPCIDRNVSLR